MIGIVNFGMGNIRSVAHALTRLGVDHRVISTPAEVAGVDRLILPGVGSYRRAMENLRRTGLEAALQDAVRGRRVPILGICLGMQIMCEWGSEDGPTDGLGWIAGATERLDAPAPLRLPHVGFNTVEFVDPDAAMGRAAGAQADFYFVHGYRLRCTDERDVAGWCRHGERFAACVRKGHIWGTQFHPEKSQSNGLLLLRAFATGAHDALAAVSAPAPLRAAGDTGLKFRLLFTLLWLDGNYVLSRNFKLQKVGDLAWIKQHYDFEAIASGIDELVVLDVGRGARNLPAFADALRELVRDCFMPLAAGGGIRSLDDAYLLMNAGADRLVVNTAWFQAPALIAELIRTFGAQSVIASIDYRHAGGTTQVVVENGTVVTGLTVEQAAARAHELGVGEIYLTAIDRDGTGQGYDLPALGRVAASTAVPVVASGGVGHGAHLADGARVPGVGAVSTANLFNFIGDGLAEAREEMLSSGIDMARWPAGWRARERFPA